MKIFRLRKQDPPPDAVPRSICTSPLVAGNDCGAYRPSDVGAESHGRLDNSGQIVSKSLRILDQILQLHSQTVALSIINH